MNGRVRHECPLQNSVFPKPVRLSKRAVGWRASDISAWLESRIDAGA